MSTDNLSPEKGTDGVSPHDHTDLTKFQLRLLAAIGAAEEPPKGIDVKQHVGEYYEREVHHGQVYPNLDELVQRGLLAKGQKNERANEYALTDAGRRVLRAETDWLVDRARAAGLGEEPAVMTDGGRNVAAGHELVTDGGVPEHLTPTNTIDGGTIYRCTRCGCEGERVVSHLDGCPAAPDGGDERVQPIATDGGQEVSDHSGRFEDRLTLRVDCPECGTVVDEWCDCPECGWYDSTEWEKAVVQNLPVDMQPLVSGMVDYPVHGRDDVTTATDGGAPQVAHLDRALEELRQARALAVAIETDAGAAIDERLRSASEELAALAEGSQ